MTAVAAAATAATAAAVATAAVAVSPCHPYLFLWGEVSFFLHFLHFFYFTNNNYLQNRAMAGPGRDMEAHWRGRGRALKMQH